MIDKIIGGMDLEFLSSIRVSNEEIFAMLKNGEDFILLDVRYPFESSLWSFSFTKTIPLNELPNRLDELDREKLIVTICSQATRSNMAAVYLLSKGFKNVKFSDDGLIDLVAKLKGGKAKSLSN
jgi:rhodanese-related sulfurtransferase